MPRALPSTWPPAAGPGRPAVPALAGRGALRRFQCVETVPRWKGIKRGYSAADVVRLRGSLQVEHTLAKRGAEKLWNLINTEPFVNSLGALTGNQAMQQVKAGLKAIYLSGWQVAGRRQQQRRDVPDQSLYRWTRCRRS